jgi:hypothetical protein
MIDNPNQAGALMRRYLPDYYVPRDPEPLELVNDRAVEFHTPLSLLERKK